MKVLRIKRIIPHHELIRLPSILAPLPPPESAMGHRLQQQTMSSDVVCNLQDGMVTSQTL